MKGAARSSRPVTAPAPAATHVVKFEQRPKRDPRREQAAPVGRVPRAARLLALAHHIDEMIRLGEIQDWADAARLAGVTRARMTQIGNLLLLAPAIQDALLCAHAMVNGDSPPSEHGLRYVLAHPDWARQESSWEQIALNRRTTSRLTCADSSMAPHSPPCLLLSPER